MGQLSEASSGDPEHIPQDQGKCGDHDAGLNLSVAIEGKSLWRELFPLGAPRTFSLGHGQVPKESENKPMSQTWKFTY